MKTNSPTHEEVSRRAQEIWNARGCPDGRDTDIWLEAERQLSVPVPAQNPPSDSQVRGSGNSQGGVAAADPTAPDPIPGGTAAKVKQQKKAARAPQQPRGKDAPKMKPTESGKPVWDKPHSS